MFPQVLSFASVWTREKRFCYDHLSFPMRQPQAKRCSAFRPPRWGEGVPGRRLEELLIGGKQFRIELFCLWRLHFRVPGSGFDPTTSV